jgi:hypothetical protein
VYRADTPDAGGGGGMKPLAHIFEPDVRYAAMVGRNTMVTYTVNVHITPSRCYTKNWAEFHSLSLWDKEFHYSVLKEFELPEYVPEDIRVQFDVALDVAMYAYFNWLMWDVAAHKTLNCYELTLRTVLHKEIASLVAKKKEKKRLNGESSTELDDFVTFSKVLGIAKAAGYINNEEYEISKEYIRKVRNMFSHKYKSLLGFPFSQNIIETCFKLICSVCSKVEQKIQAKRYSDRERAE